MKKSYSKYCVLRECCCCQKEYTGAHSACHACIKAGYNKKGGWVVRDVVTDRVMFDPSKEAREAYVKHVERITKDMALFQAMGKDPLRITCHTADRILRRK